MPSVAPTPCIANTISGQRRVPIGRNSASLLICDSSSSGNSLARARASCGERSGNRVEQLHGVLAVWMLQNLFGRALLDHLSFVEDEYLVGDHPRAEQVVGDVEQAQASFRAQAGQQP